jgi:kallikrein
MYHRKSPHELFVRAGEWDTQTRNEPLPHQDREVSIVAIHPGYNQDILHNDFALLIVSKPFDAAPNVQTTCLTDEKAYFDQSKCFATGWGKNQFGNNINIFTKPRLQMQCLIFKIIFFF